MVQRIKHRSTGQAARLITTQQGWDGMNRDEKRELLDCYKNVYRHLERYGKPTQWIREWIDSLGNVEESKADLVDHVERLLAVGKPEQAARIINDNCSCCGWGLEIRIKYFGRHSPLAPYIAADLRLRHERQIGACEPSLSPARQKLVTDHVWLVGKLAGDVARGNRALFTDLEGLGLRVLEEKARAFSFTRGSGFYAFVIRRLRGAMLDHAMFNRNRMIAVGGAKEIDIVSRPRSGRRAVPIPPEDINVFHARPKVTQSHIKASGDAALVQEYLAKGAARKFNSRRIEVRNADAMSEVRALLPRLTIERETVYRALVLEEKPVRTRADLARQFNTSERQIARWRKQAEDKITAWLLENRNNQENTGA